MTINKLNGTECGTEIAKKINTIIDEKASVSLDNLDTDGQAILDGKVNSSDLFDENEHIKINKLQSYSLPGINGTNLTVASSGPLYTVPANGWIFVRGQSTAINQFIGIEITDNSIWRNEERQVPYSGGYCTIITPVRKGETFKLWYNCSIQNFTFIYAVGSQPA